MSYMGLGSHRKMLLFLRLHVVVQGPRSIRVDTT